MTRNRSRDHKGAESGFAMLLVFLMAATLAITLYWQIPRVAFQAQRQKEQLLIERGEQYERAIQLFVRANNRYPSKIEDLENFNNRRYLRHKYKDPMTGKDEWRLIHVNAAGVFTDSIANKKKTDKPDAQASQNTFVGEEAFLVPDATQQGAQGVSAATRRRQSEGGAAPVGPDGQPLIPPPNQQALNAPPPFPGPGGQPGQDANNLQLANQLPPGQPLIPGVPGNPGQPPLTPGALAGGNPTAPYPAAAVTPGATNNLNTLNNTSQAFPQQPGAPQQPGVPQQSPFPQPGAGAFPQSGAGGFPQPGATQNPSQTGAGQNANTASPSFVGSSSSFVGSSSSFVGGSSSFVGSSTTGAPAPGNPNPVAQPGFPQPGAQPGSNQPGFSQPGFGPQNFSQPGQTPGYAQPGGQFNSVNLVNSQTATSAVAGGGVTGNPTTQSAAAGMLNNILTSPRQGGVGGGIGGGQATTGTGPQGQQIGAGIAGVASTLEAPAIMEYNQHDHYNEWEFIFDVTKQKQAANPMAANGVPGTPAGALGSVPGGTPGTPVSLAAQAGGATATASPFGATGSTSSLFGATPGTTTASPTAAGTPGQTTPGGAPGQQQSLIPPWFRFGEP
jgi:hypothetical protein